MSKGADAETLAAERAAARAAKDFARADRLRDQIAELGFDVLDVPDGWRLQPRVRTPDVSIHVLHEGFRGDLERFVGGLKTAVSHEIVVAEDGSDAEWLASLAGQDLRVERLPDQAGWAEARNRSLRASSARVLVVADLSVEPQGDIVGPLMEALEDPGVGVVGPWGLVTADLREFHEDPGPDVHAIQGYLMAMRRETFDEAAFDPWFTWYRHADLDLSFRVRALGLRAVVVPVPAERREHRGWAAVAEPERSRRSKRNFYRFLDHWRDRPDLLILRP